MDNKIVTTPAGYEVPSVSLVGQQLELFTSTNKINLTNFYSKIPKSINSEREKSIIWEGNLAQPLSIPFFNEDSKPLFSVVSPALIGNPEKTGSHKAVFPKLREDRVEWAIVQLMTKSDLQIEYKGSEISSTCIVVTPYQIRKEIVESINDREGRNLKVNDCQYSTEDIVEALKILKGTQITIFNPRGKQEYQFNRIKDLFLDGNNRQVIEINSMITRSINNLNYIPFDRALMAPSTELVSALVHYMHLTWRGKKRGTCIEMFATNLMKNVDYPFNEKISISKNISAFLKVLRSMVEIESVEIVESRGKKDGRKVVDRFLAIELSNYFFNSVITSHKINKRNQEHTKTKKGLLIKPIKEEFQTEYEYQRAIKEYYTKL